MVETLRPGVFVVEEETAPRIPQLGVATAAFVGVAQKGPTDRALLVTSYSQFVKRFGSFFQGNYLAFAVRAFFNEGGTRAFIARAVGSGAAASQITLKDHAVVNTVTLDAENPGAWGNDLSVTTEKYSLSSTLDLVAADTTITVNTVAGVEIGDLIVIDDGTTSDTRIVLGVNLSAKTLAIRAYAGTTISTPSTVKSVSKHRVKTSLNAALSNGDTSATLVEAKNVRTGQILLFANTIEEATVVVKTINGNVVGFDAITLGSPMTSGTLAVSHEFDIEVKEGSNLIETHRFLSLSNANKVDFIETRLSGDGNESLVIVADDLESASDDILELPAPVVDLPLTGGVNGATPGDNDFIGSQIAPITGMQLFKAVKEIDFFAIPGITTVAVQGAGVDFAEAQGDIMFIADARLADDEPLEVQNYRLNVLNKDSSFAALYYPWLIINDPETDNALLRIPPSGHVAGEYADTAIQRGVHKAPANVTLRGVLGLTRNVTDGEHEVLNPDGINVIRAFPGEGIRIFGARTLQSKQDGRHYVNVRRLLNFIKKSVEKGNRFAVFEPNDEELWASLREVNEAFLRGLWRNGALFPTTDITKAFFVKVDAETTTQDDIDNGIVNVVIGVNPSKPAEFVIIRVSLFSGGVDIEEIL